MPRSVAIIAVKAPVVLSEKKIHHLVDSDIIPEGLILLNVIHRVNHKHPKNLLNPVLNTTMEKVSMRKYAILEKTKTFKHWWLQGKQNFMVKIRFLHQDF